MPMDSAPVSLRSWRIGAAIVAVIATGLLALVGCTRLTGGQGAAPGESVSAYRSFVAESSAQESKRQAEASTQAMASVCNTFGISSTAAIDAGNDLIESLNNEGGYGSASAAKVGGVIDALNSSAAQVDSVKVHVQDAQLGDAFAQYVDQTRKLAGGLVARLTGDGLNTRVQSFNDSRNRARDLCASLLQGKPR